MLTILGVFIFIEDLVIYGEIVLHIKGIVTIFPPWKTNVEFEKTFSFSYT